MSGTGMLANKTCGSCFWVDYYDVGCASCEFNENDEVFMIFIFLK